MKQGENVFTRSKRKDVEWCCGSRCVMAEAQIEGRKEEDLDSRANRVQREEGRTVGSTRVTVTAAAFERRCTLGGSRTKKTKTKTGFKKERREKIRTEHFSFHQYKGNSIKGKFFDFLYLFKHTLLTLVQQLAGMFSCSLKEYPLFNFDIPCSRQSNILGNSL